MEDETPRTSLLDVVLEDYNREKDQRTSRLLFVGRVNEKANPADIVRLVDETRRSLPDDGIFSSAIGGSAEADAALTPPSDRCTGLLAVLNNMAVFGLVEGPTRLLMAVLRRLRDETVEPVTEEASSSSSSSSAAAASGTSGDAVAGAAATLSSGGAMAGSSEAAAAGAAAERVGLLKSTKVFSFTEEVPREFRAWVAQSLKVPDDEEVPAPKDWLRASFAVLKTLLELAREAALSTRSEEKAAEELLRRAEKLFNNRILPSPQRVLQFEQCEEMCSAAEFLEIYDRPVELTLESERVWPVEPPLRY